MAVFNSEKASKPVSFVCSFSTKFRTGRLRRVSTENPSQTSNREGSRVTTLIFIMCASIAAIVINKLSHLSDHVCNSCGWKV